MKRKVSITASVSLTTLAAVDNVIENNPTCIDRKSHVVDEALKLWAKVNGEKA